MNRGEEGASLEFYKTHNNSSFFFPFKRQLRLSDAKQVEAKAARIKDWVTNKLRGLEEQNDHLKAQNNHCNEQMEMLRKKLEQLQDNRIMQAAADDARRKSNAIMEVSEGHVMKLSFSCTVTWHAWDFFC
jgi:hypothetical protein